MHAHFTSCHTVLLSHEKISIFHRIFSQTDLYQLVFSMDSHNHDRHLWQHDFLEMEFALHIATQMDRATLTDHSHEPVDTEVRVARLTSENLALHNRVMSRVPEDTHSVPSHSSFEWGQPNGGSMYHITISSEPAEQLRAIRVGPIFGPPCT